MQESHLIFASTALGAEPTFWLLGNKLFTAVQTLYRLPYAIWAEESRGVPSLKVFITSNARFIEGFVSIISVFTYFVRIGSSLISRYYLKREFRYFVVCKQFIVKQSMVIRAKINNVISRKIATLRRWYNVTYFNKARKVANTTGLSFSIANKILHIRSISFRLSRSSTNIIAFSRAIYVSTGRQFQMAFNGKFFATRRTSPRKNFCLPVISRSQSRSSPLMIAFRGTKPRMQAR